MVVVEASMTFTVDAGELLAKEDDPRLRSATPIASSLVSLKGSPVSLGGTHFGIFFKYLYDF